MVRTNFFMSSTLKICAIKRLFFPANPRNAGPQIISNPHRILRQHVPTHRLSAPLPDSRPMATHCPSNPSASPSAPHILSGSSTSQSLRPTIFSWSSHSTEDNLVIRPSSREVLLWESAKVPALECLVHSANERVDHLPHGSGERVEGGVLGPRAFEVAVLVAVSAEQPLLSRSHVQKCRDEAELWEQSRLQVFVMHHQQTAAPLQPAQSVGRPPGGIAGDKLWPFCEVQTWVTVSGQKKGLSTIFNTESHAWYFQTKNYNPSLFGEEWHIVFQSMIIFSRH